MTAQRGDFDTAAPDPSFRDQLAEQAWGVLTEADFEGVTDPNLIAHAIVRNLLPLIDARVQAAANQRAAEILREVANYFTGHGIRDELILGYLTRRAAALAQPGTAET